MAPPEGTTRATLRQRKRDETRRRIAEAAAQLAAARGIGATTVDQIVEQADVGRATFFRYFESKELAVATGLSDVGLYVLVSTLRDVPARLGPLAAVRATHDVLAADFDERRAMYLEQALLCRSSAAMLAWTLHLYVDWEVAIGDAVRPRFGSIADDDPRPRMVGALAMAAARLGCDEWLAGEGTGDLPAMIRRQLDGFALTTPARTTRTGTTRTRTPSTRTTGTRTTGTRTTGTRTTGARTAGARRKAAR